MGRRRSEHEHGDVACAAQDRGARVKDRTWVHNEIGLNACARLYSTMNVEIVVGCNLPTVVLLQ